MNLHKIELSSLFSLLNFVLPLFEFNPATGLYYLPSSDVTLRPCDHMFLYEILLRLEYHKAAIDKKKQTQFNFEKDGLISNKKGKK